ncbi:MAG TPA: hypothetical protein VE988_15440 [Gemmataceae bacterium]|nr:hypothetical protein [Gemmataceae bacterium]
MRRKWTLYVAASIMLGTMGCQNHPDLKPPPGPEMLSVPTDPRFAQEARFPASELANDPVKQRLQQDGLSQVRGPRSQGMGMGMAGGGMPPN